MAPKPTDSRPWALCNLADDNPIPGDGDHFDPSIGGNKGAVADHVDQATVDLRFAGRAQTGDRGSFLTDERPRQFRQRARRVFIRQIGPQTRTQRRIANSAGRRQHQAVEDANMG